MDEKPLFSLRRGTGPVLFSVPHAGTDCPDWLRARLTDSARSLPDTDWFVDRLYAFVTELGQSLLVAHPTRYLVDLNRPPSDENLYPGQATTGLCPTLQFDGQPVYREQSEPDAAEVADRVHSYWRPYHAALEAELQRVQQEHGLVVLFDCHSIDSRLPRLFEGTLPVLNLGTNHSASTARELEAAVADVIAASRYTSAINGRFIGGFITRHYGRPAQGQHALQLEIGWDGYLDAAGAWDQQKVDQLQEVLRAIVEVLIECADVLKPPR